MVLFQEIEEAYCLASSAPLRKLPKPLQLILTRRIKELRSTQRLEITLSILIIMMSIRLKKFIVMHLPFKPDRSGHPDFIGIKRIAGLSDDRSR